MAPQNSLVIVANRLPAYFPPGSTEPEEVVGGLTTAMRSAGPRKWIGRHEEGPLRFVFEGIECHSVGLTPEMYDGFYVGFCNSVIWPEYHEKEDETEPRTDRAWWQRAETAWWGQYRDANALFAQETAATAEQGDSVWIQDFHLQLAPGMLRQMRPDVRIGFFFHTPVPSPEKSAHVPHVRELVAGVLGSDLIGFQTDVDTHHFVETVRGLVADGQKFVVNNQPVTMDGDVIRVGEREVRCETHPISINFDKYDALGRDPRVPELAEEMREAVGDRKVVTIFGRFDYTKGHDELITAVDEMIDEGTFDPTKEVVVVIASPTRGDVPRAQAYAERVADRIEGVNAKHRRVGPDGRVHEPILFFHTGLRPDEVPYVCRASDVMAVPSPKDGMNLVAKEYVASRVDEEGALILSDGAGAVNELAIGAAPDVHDRREGALVFASGDVAGLKRAIRTGLDMPREEQRRRMRAMRAQVRARPVSKWANDFVASMGRSRPGGRRRGPGGTGQRRMRQVDRDVVHLGPGSSVRRFW